MSKIFGKFFGVLAVIVGLMMLLASCTSVFGKNAVSTETTVDERRVLAEGVADSVMTALKEADFAELSTLSKAKFSSINFLDLDWSRSKDLYKAIFGSMTWEFGEGEFVSDSVFSIDVEMTYKDPLAAGEAVIGDDDKRLNVAGILVLGFIEMDDAVYEKALSESADVLSEYLITELQKNPKEITTKGTIELAYNTEQNRWVLTELPEIFTVCGNCTQNVDPFVRLPEEEIESSYVEASSRLLSEEKITPFVYDILYLTYGEQVEESVESLKKDLLANEWFDFETMELAKNYIAGSTKLVYFFAFNEEHIGVVFEYEFYKDGQSDSLVSGKKIFTDRQELNAILINTNIPEGLTKGTYYVKIRLADGTIFIEDEINVK